MDLLSIQKVEVIHEGDQQQWDGDAYPAQHHLVQARTLLCALCGQEDKNGH